MAGGCGSAMNDPRKGPQHGRDRLTWFWRSEYGFRCRYRRKGPVSWRAKPLGCIGGGHNGGVPADLGGFAHRRATGHVHVPHRAKISRPRAADGAAQDPGRSRIRRLDARRNAGRHLGCGDAGRAAFRGPLADRLSRPVGGCPQGRLRRRRDAGRERRRRHLGLGAAAESGPVLVPHSRFGALFGHLPLLQRLDRRFLQTPSAAPQGHRDAERRRPRCRRQGA